MNSWFEIPKSLFCEETQRFQFYAAGCVCVCLFVCACACLCVRAPACACLRVCVFCVCLCVCLCVCVCVCVCLYRRSLCEVCSTDYSSNVAVLSIHCTGENMKAWKEKHTKPNIPVIVAMHLMFTLPFLSIIT